MMKKKIPRIMLMMDKNWMKQTIIQEGRIYVTLSSSISSFLKRLAAIPNHQIHSRHITKAKGTKSLKICKVSQCDIPWLGTANSFEFTNFRSLALCWHWELNDSQLFAAAALYKIVFYESWGSMCANYVLGGLIL